MTGEAEALAGARAAPLVEARFRGLISDPVAEQRMVRIARRLARGRPQLQGSYQCRLLASDQMNAVSLPGGRIYITRGLYRRLATDSLVAAVLAHEMAHLASKDSLKPRCRDLEESLNRELSADTRGAGYLEAAGFRPAALVELVYLIKDGQPAGWVAARLANLSNLRVGSDIQLAHLDDRR